MTEEIHVLRCKVAEMEVQLYRKRWATMFPIPADEAHELLNLIENTLNGSRDAQLLTMRIVSIREVIEMKRNEHEVK